MTKFDFSKMTDSELVSWFIMALNGADFNNSEDCAMYDAACDESLKRSKEVQKEIVYLQQVI